MCKKIPDIGELKKGSFNELLNKDFRKRLDGRRVGYQLLKRFIDVLIAFLALVVFSPVWLLICIIIRADSKGKAIFSHERAGKDGKIFRLYKFRTMYQGVKNQELAPTSSVDPRITRMGRFLRKTSLDEVPQFWNVLKGEMSVVGPRPEMHFIVKKYSRFQKCRLIVKPGITGLWQIKGRKDLPLQENIEYDFYYILNRSLLMDLIILLKTVTVIISGKGAY